MIESDTEKAYVEILRDRCDKYVDYYYYFITVIINDYYY